MFNRTRVGTTVIAACLVIGPVQGQTVSEPRRVQVGDGVVDGSFLREYHSRFSLTKIAAEGDSTPHGAWTDQLTVIMQDGHPVMRRDVARFTADGTQDLERYHLVDLATLAPIETVQRMGPGLGGGVELRFDGTTVRVVVRAAEGSPAQEATFTVEEPVFDLSLWAMLLVGFPLAEGYEAMFPTLGQTGQLEWEHLRVTGRETVTVEDGRRVQALVVSTTIRPWTVWLTREPPYIARVIQRSPDGSQIVSTRMGSSVP